MKKQCAFLLAIVLILFFSVNLRLGASPRYEITDLSIFPDRYYSSSVGIKNAGKIIYVDADANGLNDGSSWENAYNYLKDALADADSSPKPVVIRVAQGTYNPYQSSAHPDDNGYHPSATFRLRNNVAIRGGYAGFGHPDPNARYVYAYETILSGKSNQSYHVVTALWVDETAILDGFTVTGGYAHGRDHYYGGGMFIGGGSGPTVMNCKFVKNSASTAGGIYIGEDTAPMIINCIFSQNRAYNNGGGIWNYYASPTLINCVFVDNSADDGSGGGISSYTHGMLTLINCTFSNNEAIWNGGGIYNSYSTTLSMTNCILWNNRDRHGVDESAQISGAISIINFCCIQGWTGALGGTGNIGTEPLLVDPDHDNCRLWAGSPCINAGDNSAVPLLIVTDADGNPRIVDGTVDMGAYELQHPPILYVDIDATGANDGSSWANAYNYLQDALADANSSHKPVEIWVAEGIYKPDQGSNITPGDREATFQLVNRVSLMGGYAGYGEPEPDARNIVLYRTILSGDLNSDDCPNFANNDENSYHVVTTTGTDRSAVLYGFTVTAGNANGSDLEDNNCGAGIYNYYGSPTLIHCTIAGNSATSDFPAIWACGGGMYSVGSDSSPTLTDCVFTNNSASAGGGMYSDVWSHPALTSCKFICNRAREDGGGMYNRHSSNIATILTNCTFVGNSAGNRGGGMHNKGYAISTRLVNCIFSGNSAKYGGGMANFLRSTAILTNCTFNGNSALEGNALWCEMGTFVDPRYPSNLRLTNCILWDAGNEIWNDTDSVITLSYCNVHGGWPGGGNIDADPCFVMPGYWNADGVWINGVYYLLTDSPCIDAGKDAGVYDDIEGNIRPFDYQGVDNNGELPEFDMGAYEAVPLIEVPMKLTPHVLNCRSKGKWVKAHLVLPAGFTVEDVNSNSIATVHPLGIELHHVDIFVNDDNLVEIEATFGRAYLCRILRGIWFSVVTITVRGSFTTGQYFYGMDTIRIIDDSYEQLALLSLHWLDVNCSEPDWCDGTDINQDFTVNFNDFALMACH